MYVLLRTEAALRLVTTGIIALTVTFCPIPAAMGLTPIDVIPAANSSNKGKILEAKLIPALKWLKEFEHEWNKRGQT